MQRTRRAFSLAFVTISLLVVLDARAGSPGRLPPVTPPHLQAPPQVAGCAVFPADNIWNTPVDTFRFTAPRTRRAYVWPARHYASSLTGSHYPPMGQRFRLRADFDVSGFSPDAQVILRALKRYGLILADNGGAWYISGAPDERWDNDVLHELHPPIPPSTGGERGADFEAVDVSSLMVNPDSAQVRRSRATARQPSEIVVDKWALWSEGTHLRGANVYQRRVYPELDGPDFMGPGPVGPPYTQEDFDRLAALGANVVNISHPGLFTEDPPYVLDPGIQANLDNLLSKIAQADMFAVISFRTGPGRSEFTFFWDEVGTWFDESYLNDSVWGDQAAQDAWVEMWRYTAQRYRDNPIVAGYDLMVEPNSNEVGSDALHDRLDIWDPQEFYNQYGGTLYDWNQLYPRISAAIRQVDPDTPILIGGNGYSGLDWLPYLEPTGDLRTVYTAHQYEPHKYTHQDPGVQECSYPGTCDTDWDGEPDPFDWVWLDGRLATVEAFKATHHVPVAINEFGLVRWTPNAHTFMDDEMDLFEQQGVNHALWVWDPSWEPWASQIDAFNFRHGPDPDNHTDVPNALMDVIVEQWAGNALRPSTTAICPDLVPPAGVGLEDVQAAAGRWQMTSTDPDWDPRYDRSSDGRVDILDIMRVVVYWGKDCVDS